MVVAETTVILGFRNVVRHFVAFQTTLESFSFLKKYCENIYLNVFPLSFSLLNLLCPNVLAAGSDFTTSLHRMEWNKTLQIPVP